MALNSLLCADVPLSTYTLTKTAALQSSRSRDFGDYKMAVYYNEHIEQQRSEYTNWAVQR